MNFKWFFSGESFEVQHNFAYIWISAKAKLFVKKQAMNINLDLCGSTRVYVLQACYCVKCSLLCRSQRFTFAQKWCAILVCLLILVCCSNYKIHWHSCNYVPAFDSVVNLYYLPWMNTYWTVFWKKNHTHKFSLTNAHSLRLQNECVCFCIERITGGQ